jgi:hypothetical protein
LNEIKCALETGLNVKIQDGGGGGTLPPTPFHEKKPKRIFKKKKTYVERSKETELSLRLGTKLCKTFLHGKLGEIILQEYE